MTKVCVCKTPLQQSDILRAHLRVQVNLVKRCLKTTKRLIRRSPTTLTRTTTPELKSSTEHRMASSKPEKKASSHRNFSRSATSDCPYLTSYHQSDVFFPLICHTKIEKSSVQRRGVYLSITRVDFVLSIEIVAYIVFFFRCCGCSHLEAYKFVYEDENH